MISGLSEIERSAQLLSAAEREQLARKLFESVHGKELPEVDAAWLTVAEERLKAFDSGEDSGIGEEEFFNRVQTDLGWK